MIERIMVAGVQWGPTAITIQDNYLWYGYDGSSSVIIKQPNVPIGADWTIIFQS